MKTIQMLGSGRLDHRTAGLMLYALQTASINLRNADFEANDVTEVVINRDDVPRTNLGGPQWSEDDFEEPAEEGEADDAVANETEDETENEADDEDAVAAAQVTAAAGQKKVAHMKPVSLEETRMKVEGVVRNWLQENGREKAAAKPD